MRSANNWSLCSACWLWFTTMLGLSLIGDERGKGERGKQFNALPVRSYKKLLLSLSFPSSKSAFEPKEEEDEILIVTDPIVSKSVAGNTVDAIKERIRQDLRVPLSSIGNATGEISAPKRDIIIFSDFDGTIFMQDTGHILFDSHGCGPQRREELDEEIKSGVRSFRDVSEEMWGSLNVPFENGFEVMKSALEIDPDFRDFHKFCLERNIPFNVISAGLKPILRAVLDEFLGVKQSQHIDIIANDADITEDGSEWKPIWLHDTPLGHDKAASIKEYRTTASSESDDGSCPLVVFVGDGVSDLPAAHEADVLFARKGLRLEEYCIENKIPYIPFATFADIEKEIGNIIRDDEKTTKGQGKPAQYNPRASYWRRYSGKRNVETLGLLNASDKLSQNNPFKTAPVIR